MTGTLIKKLCLSIGGKDILKNISFDLHPGKITGLVGESGSGKSLTALSIMRLLPQGSVLSGNINFENEDLVAANEDRMCQLRGDDIGMVFQEPMTALNPLKTIGDQVAEGIEIHARVSRSEALARAKAILERVGLPSAKYSLSRFPHELSGGQRQRVVIAMACAMKPKLLIADEPTTALDVLVQAQILELLGELVSENNMALLLISHDLGVVAELADDIVILRNGEVMEQGETVEILEKQRHPYTRQLAEASRHVPVKQKNLGKSNDVIATISGLVCKYPGIRRSIFTKPEPFTAVNNVSFEISKRQILGLVGESGCGKSTLSRAILGLEKPASGTITLHGPKDIHSNSHIVQAVFQDPYGSFNPRHRAEDLVAEPMFNQQLSSTDKRHRVVEALESVGLSTNDLRKYPHEFSGGQRQRLAIARAIVMKPGLIIADEPVSALDVSIRAQILDLIIDLRQRFNIAWLFVSHDLSVVRALCDNVMVMKDGIIVEQGPVETVYNNPENDYTRALINAAPNLDAAIKQRTATIRT